MPLSMIRIRLRPALMLSTIALLAMTPCDIMAQDEPEEKDERPAIAVMDFTAVNTPGPVAIAVGNIVRDGLIKSGRFVIIERSATADILSEQAFQKSGCTTVECAVEIGKLLNCKFMVVGDVTQLGGTYQVSVRVVEVETAKTPVSDVQHAESQRGLLDIASKLAEDMAQLIGGEQIVRRYADEVRPIAVYGVLHLLLGDASVFLSPESGQVELGTGNGGGNGDDPPAAEYRAISSALYERVFGPDESILPALGGGVGLRYSLFPWLVLDGSYGFLQTGSQEAGLIRLVETTDKKDILSQDMPAATFMSFLRFSVLYSWQVIPSISLLGGAGFGQITFKFTESPASADSSSTALQDAFMLIPEPSEVTMGGLLGRLGLEWRPRPSLGLAFFANFWLEPSSSQVGVVSSPVGAAAVRGFSAVVFDVKVPTVFFELSTSLHF